MASVTAVAVAAGPLAVCGYIMGAGLNAARERESHPIARIGIELLTGVSAATLAWYITKWVAPDGRVSTVAYASDQVLLAWQSMALWAGAAAIVGAVAPPGQGVRAGDGSLVLAGLLLVYAPTLAIGAAIAAAVRLALGGGAIRDAVPYALAGALLTSWLAWIAETSDAWGVSNGPELTLWATVASGVVFVAWRRDS